jgi:3-hydroxymyristoyl/3-hydroxydecanoyl-(acyl carrier protein) dehydratase
MTPIDDAAMQSVPLTIAADHPAFAGHFPGAPMLPGVVLLDAALASVVASGTLPDGPFRIASAKFFQPALPGAALVIRHRRAANGAIEFDIASGADRIASGSFAPA